MNASSTSLFERFALPGPAAACPKKTGRPKVLTTDYLAALLVEHSAIADWYQTQFGKPPRSDVQLLTTYFSTECEKRGLRAGRVNSAEMKARIKTLRNQLATARNLVVSVPKSHIYSGCAPDETSHVQRRTRANKDVQ